MIKSKRSIALFKVTMFFMMCFVFLRGCQNSDAKLETSEANTEAVSTATPDKDVILIVTGEYAPYTSQTQDNSGFLTEIVEAVLKESGMEYEIKFYPWERCSQMVLTGEAWASFPYGFSEEKALLYNFSDSVFSSKHKFYYLVGNEKIGDEVMEFSKISDFSNFTFGGANGYWYGDQAEFDHNGVKVEWANDTDALIKMLHSGRIDFLVEDELVCDTAIERIFPDAIDDFDKLPIYAKIQDYFLLISKEYPETQGITEQFNNALKKLIENGEISSILDKNGIEY